MMASISSVRDFDAVG